MRAGGGAPTRARTPPAWPHAGPPRASSAGMRPQPGPGGFRRPGASPHTSEERASSRAGGRAAHAGWPPRALARQPPACAALSLGLVQAASDARARLPAPRRSAPRAGVGAELPMRGGPCWRSLASPRPAPPSASARSRRLQTPGRVSPRLGGARLRPGRGPSCPCGVDLRALCVLTQRGCPILYVPAQCAPAKTEALLPSRFQEGRRDRQRSPIFTLLLILLTMPS